MSLYHKYRPETFEDIIGNTTLISSLTGVLNKKDKDKPHAFFFHGETGCGKTTLGRIVANVLGCVGNDFREVNSAEMRGIDTVRDIIKKAQFAPLEGPCRIWLIDECHKMTNDAQNAFLKILEDTPPHIFFIFCTTEPTKVIKAIHGRCSTYQVALLNDKEMRKLIRNAVLGEGETLEGDVYQQIILDSMGHPRNALQILEQVLEVPEDERLEVAKVKAAEYNEIIELCRILLSGKANWKDIAAILRGIKGQDPESIRRVVIGYAQAILLKGTVNDTCGLILECFKEPTYNSGFPQIVLSCYSVIRN